MRFARLLLFLLARFWRWDSGLPHGGMIPPWSAAESQTKEECELFSFAASRAKHCRGESEPDAAVDNVRKRESAAVGGTSDKMAQSPERRPDLPPARILPPIQRQPLKGQV